MDQRWHWFFVVSMRFNAGAISWVLQMQLYNEINTQTRKLARIQSIKNTSLAFVVFSEPMGRITPSMVPILLPLPNAKFGFSFLKRLLNHLHTTPNSKRSLTDFVRILDMLWILYWHADSPFSRKQNLLRTVMRP